MVTIKTAHLVFFSRAVKTGSRSTSFSRVQPLLEPHFTGNLALILGQGKFTRNVFTLVGTLFISIFSFSTLHHQHDDGHRRGSNLWPTQSALEVSYGCNFVLFLCPVCIRVSPWACEISIIAAGELTLPPRG